MELTKEHFAGFTSPIPIKAHFWKLSYCLWPDLTGLRVLDVGSYDGFYAKAAILRGAESVACIDNDPLKVDIAMKNCAGLRVSFILMNAVDLTNRIASFDVVFLMGILYHVGSPFSVLQAAKRMAPVTVVESHLDCRDIDRPVARVYDVDGIDNDETNYWGFNAPGLENLFRRAGFTKIVKTCEHNAPDDQIVTGRGSWILK
jgi:tRNA (mo5U34)-methyltransferase